MGMVRRFSTTTSCAPVERALELGRIRWGGSVDGQTGDGAIHWALAGHGAGAEAELPERLTPGLGDD